MSAFKKLSMCLRVNKIKVRVLDTLNFFLTRSTHYYRATEARIVSLLHLHWLHSYASLPCFRSMSKLFGPMPVFTRDRDCLQRITILRLTQVAPSPWKVLCIALLRSFLARQILKNSTEDRKVIPFMPSVRQKEYGVAIAVLTSPWRTAWSKHSIRQEIRLLWEGCVWLENA